MMGLMDIRFHQLLKHHLFANGDTSLYPFSFPNGGTIEFTVICTQIYGESMEVYFKFEANPYPNTEPSFQAEGVFSGQSQQITVYHLVHKEEIHLINVLLYLGERDMLVSIECDCL